MSWRERMTPIHSNAEFAVMAELRARGLHGFQLDQRICLRWTIPDLLFHLPNKQVPVYLDGPHHLKSRQIEKDDEIDMLLRKLGIEPLRFPYKAPLTQKKLKEICDTIQQVVRPQMKRFRESRIERR